MSPTNEQQLTENSVDAVVDLSDAAAAEEPVENAPSLSDSDDGEVRRALEALLIISDEPLYAVDLAVAIDVPENRVASLLEELAEDYRESGRGFELRLGDHGWRLYSAADCSEIIAHYVKAGKSAKLSQAALETLAVVAYRQPVSRARIGAIRGVNVDGVMRTLVTRDLVAEMETDPATGAVLYGTTPYFLERMGLNSIAELPPIADYLPDLSSLDDLLEP